MQSYSTLSPVLFLIFNRPDTTFQVFEKIREAMPPRIYIAADGPRTTKEGEAELCNKTRAVAELVDWPCEVKTFFRDGNLGCKYAVSSAIGWFFEQEEEGIILEDDCLPSNDFFRFCDELLNKYRYDTRITQVAGCNVQLGKKWGNYSYYFSNNVEVWGWASWKRVWKNYDVELSNYDEYEVKHVISNLFGDKLVTEKFKEVFIELKQGKIDTWDFQLRFINFFHNGLCVIPNVNLVSNIGFRADGTHTFNPDDVYSNIPLENLPVIDHPKYFVPEREADLTTIYKDFNIKKPKAGLKGMIDIFKKRS